MKRKEWIVYGTLLFITCLGILEITLSFAFLSLLSPTNSSLFVTPLAFFTTSVFAGIVGLLYLLGLIYVLKRHVFIKIDEKVTYNKDGAILLLPFYLISGVSLSLHLGYTPLDLTFLPTYIFFAVFVESFYEYLHIVDLKDVKKLDIRGKSNTAVVFVLVLSLIVASSGMVMGGEDREDGSIGVGVYPDEIEVDLPAVIERGDDITFSADRVNLTERLDEDELDLGNETKEIEDDREIIDTRWEIEYEGEIVAEGHGEWDHEFENVGTYTIYVDASCDLCDDGDVYEYSEEVTLEVERSIFLDVCSLWILWLILLLVIVLLIYLNRKKIKRILSSNEDKELQDEKGKDDNSGDNSDNNSNLSGKGKKINNEEVNAGNREDPKEFRDELEELENEIERQEAKGELMDEVEELENELEI